jgi:hypothetical protein
VDAEAVLLIDDGDGKVVEPDGFGEEGVRAHQDVEFPRFAAAKDGLALGRRCGAGEQGGTDLGAGEHAGDRVEVLLGEDLGRGHERRLLIGGDSHEHGVERDDGLAGAHIALDEAVGGCVAREVFDQFGDDGILRFGEREREALADVLVDFGGPAERRSAKRLAEVGALEVDPELEEEQLVVGEAAACRGNLIHRSRLVDHAIRISEGGEFADLAELIAEVVFDERERRGERGVDRFLNDPGGDGLDRGGTRRGYVRRARRGRGPR